MSISPELTVRERAVMSPAVAASDHRYMVRPVRIAVTGGSGFIGSHVVDKLLDAGHTVVVIDVRPPHRPDALFVRGDVLDPEALRKGLRDCDVVFHLAG